LQMGKPKKKKKEKENALVKNTYIES